jgi:Protein of unknown function (DUF2652)/Polyketide cyclase / dehydrase and lipid transport
MTPSVGQPEQRIFVIADLSGYTGYLVQGEDEEAPLIAGDLVETIVTRLASGFELAGIEGDAVFVHAPLAAMSGEHLLNAIGECHAAFQRRIESVRLATTCTCSACQRAPTLELKFFVHTGPAAIQRIAGREELAGRDVILVHRLMKDSAPATLGLQTYVLLTDAAVAALRIQPTPRLSRVVQTYEHFGDVVGWVGDPRSWAHGAEATLNAESPAVDLEVTLDAPPSAVWDLLTLPIERERWEGIERVEDLDPELPRGLGTRSRCIARRLATIEEIVDWRPISSMARRSRRGEHTITVRYDLEEDGSATQLRVRWYGPPDGAGPGGPTGRDEVATSVERLARVAATVSG